MLVIIGCLVGLTLLLVASGIAEDGNVGASIVLALFGIGLILLSLTVHEEKQFEEYKDELKSSGYNVLEVKNEDKAVVIYEDQAYKCTIIRLNDRITLPPYEDCEKI